MNFRIFEGYEIDGTYDTWYKEKKGMTLQKERKMKKVVRMLGGAFVLLIMVFMVITLVSCDDDLLPNGEHNGFPDLPDNGFPDPPDGWHAEWPDDWKNEWPGDWPGELPEDFSFELPEALPSTCDGTRALIQSVEDAIVIIKNDLNTAKGNTEINDLPALDEGSIQYKAKTAFDGLLANRNPKHPGITLFQFGLYGDSTKENISGVTIDFDSPEGCFMDMMNEQGAFINIELDSKFTINEAEGVPEELPGSYEISLKGALMEKAPGTDVIVIGSTLEKTGEGAWNKNLTGTDVKFDDEGDYEWNQAGAEPHQKILTLLMSSLGGANMEESANMWFYFDVTFEGVEGKFIAGITAFGAERKSYSSVIWKDNDNNEHLIVWSNHKDYEDFIVIDKVAYKLPKT